MLRARDQTPGQQAANAQPEFAVSAACSMSVCVQHLALQHAKAYTCPYHAFTEA